MIFSPLLCIPPRKLSLSTNCIEKIANLNGLSECCTHADTTSVCCMQGRNKGVKTMEVTDCGGPTVVAGCNKDTHICLKQLVLLVMQAPSPTRSPSPLHSPPIKRQAPQYIFHSGPPEFIAAPLDKWHNVCKSCLLA